MISKFRHLLGRFGKDERGSVSVVEFVVMVPLIFTAFMMSVEMGVYSIRQMFLDRGLDTTVRFVRLNPNLETTHYQLKDMICDGAGFLPSCKSQLKLEMKSLNPRNFAAFDTAPACVDLAEPVEQDKGITFGREHELMVLRACYRFRPIFPTSGLGYAMEENGTNRMVSVNVFVQEPK